MQRMLVSAESVFGLIDQKPEIDKGTFVFEGQVKGKVEFDHISHRFPDAQRDTLADAGVRHWAVQVCRKGPGVPLAAGADIEAPVGARIPRFEVRGAEKTLGR